MYQTSLIEESAVAYRIEPFYFKQDFSNINELTGFRPLNFTKEMFYDHIDKLMFLKEKDPLFNSQIAKTYQINWKEKKISYTDSYQKDEVKPFPIQGTVFEYIVEETDEAEGTALKRFIRFKIQNIQVILSEMQVGFLVYDLKDIHIFEERNGERHLIPQTLENYEWVTYHLRKFQIAEKGYLLVYLKDPEQEAILKAYKKRKGEAVQNNQPFSEEKPEEPKILPFPVKWTDLSIGLLGELGEIHSFFNKKRIGYHTLLYSSAFIDYPMNGEGDGQITKEFEAMLANKVYKISHGYKDTYYKEVQAEDVVRPFENILWCLSPEGAANIVYPVPNKQAMKFFDDSFKQKRKTNYYFMYILALLQKYSLLYYSLHTTEILYQSSLYIDRQRSKEELNKELTRTRDFYGKILKFTIRGYFEQVSYHSHYNFIYDRLIKALRIPELQQELTPKMEAFRQLIETLVYEENEKEKDKQNHIVQTVTYFLLPATLTTGILGMNIPLITKSTNFYLAYAFLGVTFITSLLSLVLNKGKGKPALMIMVLSIVLLAAVTILDIYYDPPELVDKSE